MFQDSTRTGRSAAGPAAGGGWPEDADAGAGEGAGVAAGAGADAEAADRADAADGAAAADGSSSAPLARVRAQLSVVAVRPGCPVLRPARRPALR
ncbi:hypothetical protein GCM10009863_52970 [Streptomyces axinellae]|uniref:Uncharacterized protein n=1 Tax=Streptomyces axinellae TaxID=552788 RepID=A0ABN3QMZ7_9ACTN